MGRPKKYEGYDIYAPQRKYLKTEKGKAARKRYNETDKAKVSKRKYKRKRDGTIVDRKQHFIDTYGDIETALKLLDRREQFVITSLNGLDGNKPMTQKKVGEELSLSDTRIRQINQKALEKLAPLKRQTETESESDDQ